MALRASFRRDAANLSLGNTDLELLPPRAALPAPPAATGPTTFTALPDDAFRQIARRLPVRDRPNLALAGKGLSGPVRQSLERLGLLAAPVRGVAALPAGEPRLRAVLDAMFASAQPQLTASERSWLLRAAVVRTALLEPPHRFVFHRVACGESRHLPPDERAALIAVLAAQLPKLPMWVTPQAPLQPDLRPPFLRMTEASVSSQPGQGIFDAGIPSEEKTACAVALAAHFEQARFRGPETIAVLCEAFEDCRRLALELPASLQSAPLEALAVQVHALPLLYVEPHPLAGQPPRMMGVGVARILAATAARDSKERLQVLTRLGIQMGKMDAGHQLIYRAMLRQVRQHLATHPLQPMHAHTLDQALKGIDSRRAKWGEGVRR